MVMIGGLTRTSLVGVKTSLPSSCDHAETLTCTTTASVPLFLTVTATLRFAGERSTRIGLTSNEPAFAPSESADTRKNSSPHLPDPKPPPQPPGLREPPRPFTAAR